VEPEQTVVVTRRWYGKQVSAATSQSQSYVTTDGQSASQSWRQALSEAQYHIFFTVRQLRFLQCGAPSLTKGRVCSSICPVGLMTKFC
jgi:hypothetical protein